MLTLNHSPAPGLPSDPQRLARAETFTFRESSGKEFQITAPPYSSEHRGDMQLALRARLVLERSMQDPAPVSEAGTASMPSFRRDGYGMVTVVEGDSLTTAHRIWDMHGRVAVLNMANAFNPGGGFFNGARAQEESLGRSTNLIPSLCRYEQTHPRAGGAYIHAGQALYTPGVAVYSDRNGVPVEQLCEVDIVSAAALQFRSGKLVDRDAEAFGFPKDMPLPEPGNEHFEAYKEYLTLTVRNILEAARAREVRNVILGAIGCGAFGNDPTRVAEVFDQVLNREDYRHLFNQIVFAILVSRPQDQRNIEAFRQVFQ